MNGLVSFRLCTLTDKELIKIVDSHVDGLYKYGRIPSRHIPAKPNEDFDLVVGELIVRFNERSNAV